MKTQTSLKIPGTFELCSHESSYFNHVFLSKTFSEQLSKDFAYHYLDKSVGDDREISIDIYHKNQGNSPISKLHLLETKSRVNDYCHDEKVWYPHTSPAQSLIINPTLSPEFQSVDLSEKVNYLADKGLELYLLETKKVLTVALTACPHKNPYSYTWEGFKREFH